MALQERVPYRVGDWMAVVVSPPDGSRQFIMIDRIMPDGVGVHTYEAEETWWELTFPKSWLKNVGTPEARVVVPRRVFTDNGMSWTAIENPTGSIKLAVFPALD